jgi:hypothetical protein
MILATIAAPTGILAAIDKRAAQRNETHEKLLRRAGVTQEAYDALSTALAGANAETLRRLLNASHAALCILEQTNAIDEARMAESHNGQFNTPFGDL